MIGFIIVDHKDNSVTENEEENSILKPPPSDQPNETSSQLTVVTYTA